MTPGRRRQIFSLGALAVGVVLFAATLSFIDFGIVFAAGRRLVLATAFAILASGLWHLARTWAWAWSFPRSSRLGFAHLFRVRIAAEAFSYLTISGIAGEPLKVVLLANDVDARESSAAVALERLAYLAGTTIIVGAGSAIALARLPLAPLWVHVFRGFAIGSGVIVVLTVVALTGRGSYVRGALARFDRRFGTQVSSGRAGRFAGDVEAQLLKLVRGNGTRLAMLAAAAIICYLCMSAEAWLILTAFGIPISLTGAVAIETFSRVASFASVFIPANLGALEAYSVAAAAAVGATGAGAPLALARRLRGVFWAGLGLLIYPRGPRRAGGAAHPDARRDTPGPTLLFLPTDPSVRVPSGTRLAGLSIAERVVRSAFRAGYSRVIVWCPDAARPEGRMRDVRGDVRTVCSTERWTREIGELPPNATVTAIGAGTVVSPALLADAADITARPAAPRDVPAGDAWPTSGVLRLNVADAFDVDALARRLRDRLVRRVPLPAGDDVSYGRGRLVLRTVDPDDVPAAEAVLRRSSYKPTDATIARFNRRISLPISVALIRTPITANQVSVALVAIGFYAGWLFSFGHYWTGVLGAFLSLAASVLDGCDGEIARLKYQESALGCWIETAGDYSYYLAIFAGLTIGAVRRTGWPALYWIGGTAIIGLILTFALLIYLRSRITAGRPERLHMIAKARFQAEPTLWSRVIWRISVAATRAAMPYGIMALALLGLLPLVVVLAAVGSNTYWISLVLKLQHLLGDQDADTVAA